MGELSRRRQRRKHAADGGPSAVRPAVQDGAGTRSTLRRWAFWISTAAALAVLVFMMSRRPPSRGVTTGVPEGDPRAGVLERPLLPTVASDLTVEAMAAEAQSVADRTVAEFPESGEAHSVVGQVHSLFGRSSEAMQSWRRAIQCDPQFAHAYRQIGGNLMEDGNYTEAAEVLRRAWTVDPTLPEVANQLATALMHAGEMQEAQAVLDQQLASSSAGAETYFLMGQVLIQKRQFEQARQQLQRALELDPQHTQACYGMMRACVALGDHPALADWRARFQELKAAEEQQGLDKMRRREDGARVRRYLAVAYREAGKVYHLYGRTAEAEAHWLMAAALDPTDTESRRALALLFRRQDEPARLLAILQQLREIDPADPQHALEVGQLLFNVGRYAAAEEILLELCEVAPDRAAGFHALAFLYVQTNRETRRAVELARRAVELEPSAEHYFVLGVACQAADDRPSAWQAIGRAVELEPRNSVYREAYETLRKSL